MNKKFSAVSLVDVAKSRTFSAMHNLFMAGRLVARVEVADVQDNGLSRRPFAGIGELVRREHDPNNVPRPATLLLPPEITPGKLLDTPYTMWNGVSCIAVELNEPDFVLGKTEDFLSERYLDGVESTAPDEVYQDRVAAHFPDSYTSVPDFVSALKAMDACLVTNEALIRGISIDKSVGIILKAPLSYTGIKQVLRWQRFLKTYRSDKTLPNNRLFPNGLPMGMYTQKGELHEVTMGVLQRKLTQLETDFGKLEQHVATNDYQGETLESLSLYEDRMSFAAMYAEKVAERKACEDLIGLILDYKEEVASKADLLCYDKPKRSQDSLEDVVRRKDRIKIQDLAILLGEYKSFFNDEDIFDLISRLHHRIDVLSKRLDGLAPVLQDPLLYIAAYNGDLSLMESLSKPNVNLCQKDDRGISALHYAAYYGHWDVALCLIKKGIKDDLYFEDRNHLLLQAVMAGKVDVVDALIKAASQYGHWTDPDPAAMDHRNVYQYSALGYAILKKDSEMVKRLIRHHVNVYLEQGVKKNTPLTLAISKGDLGIAREVLLASINADKASKIGPKLVNQANRDGMTPLMFAALLGNAALVKNLIEFGADIKAYNKNSESALILAASRGHAAVVDVLLEAGADPNAHQLLKNTALLNAVLQGNPEVVRLLVKAGAELFTFNHQMHSPMLVATQNANRRYVDIMRGCESSPSNTNPGLSQSERTLLYTMPYPGTQDLIKIEIPSFSLSKGEKDGLRARLDHPAWSAVFSAINEKIASRPYQAPNCDTHRWMVEGQALHRPNHNGTHSARQARVLDFVLSELDDDDYSAEEKSAMRLMAYCYRLGRRDELDAKSTGLEAKDNYRYRSAEIYAALARNLGFSESLCDWGKAIIGRPHHLPLDNEKAERTYQLINMVHEADLIRCYSDKEISDIKDEIASLDLIKKFPEDFVERLFLFSERLIKSTGFPLGRRSSELSLGPFKLHSSKGDLCWKNLCQVSFDGELSV